MKNIRNRKQYKGVKYSHRQRKRDFLSVGILCLEKIMGKIYTESSENASSFFILLMNGNVVHYMKYGENEEVRG